MKNYAQGTIIRNFEGNEEELRKVRETRTVRFVISTSAKDRHGTVLNQAGWKLDAFNSNPIVGYQHNVYGDNMCTGPNPDDVLGPGRAWVEDGVLMGEVTFETADINPLAEKIFQKVLNGTLRATSVGFIEVGKGKHKEELDAKGNKVETYYFDGQELLEFSIVNIPSNPEATKKSLVNHTKAGIGFLTRMGLKVSDVRKIANDILDQLEAENKEEEQIGPDPSSHRYMEILNKRKTQKNA